MAKSDSQLPDRGAQRRAFTLVELMVTLGIIVVLATMVGLVASGATEAAKVAKTRALRLPSLTSLIMQPAESYRFRRLPIALPPGLTPLQAAQVRCDAIRQLMRMEMPDRWTDISDAPAPVGTAAPASLSSPVTMPRPSASLAYYNFWSAHPPNDNLISPKPNVFTCLSRWAWKKTMCWRTFLRAKLRVSPVAIKFNVFIGGFGEAIDFHRWAPGFIGNPVVPTNTAKILPPYSNVSQLQTGHDRDQTDPTGVYGNPAPLGSNPTPANTYALYPLLYSCGPDGTYMLINDQLQSYPPLHYANTTPPNNPFVGIGDAVHFPYGPIGTPADNLGVPDESYMDNIHNHLLGLH